MKEDDHNKSRTNARYYYSSIRRKKLRNKKMTFANQIQY